MSKFKHITFTLLATAVFTLLGRGLGGYGKGNKYIHVTMVFTLIFSLFSFNHNAHGQQIEPIVKVKLVNFLGNKTEITLKPNDHYATSDSNVMLESNHTYLLKHENGKLALYKDNILLNSYETFSVLPLQPKSQLSINDRPYLGSFDFLVENNIYVRPINSVYMEDYLKGVVPIEMYPSWNIEALKTQAVAARTYAMKYINNGTINDTISYQVYGGNIWTPNTTKAVDETKGQVLQYNGRLIDAVYSASNGGITESNANAWGSTAVPYLNMIKKDDYDPKTGWNFSFNKTQIDLTEKDLSQSSEWWNSVKEADTTISNNIKMWLKSNGYANEDIKIVSIPDISFHGAGSGGRVTKGSITVDFLVKDMTEATGKLIPQRISFKDTTASKVRSIIGTRLMLSYLVASTDITENNIIVKGIGDGHGVGMSQWGAKYMADAGKSYKDILNFYYTGTIITEMYQVSDKNMNPPAMTEIKVPATEQTPGSTHVDAPSTPEQADEQAQPAKVQDTQAPIIKDIATKYNHSTKKTSLTYSVNEEVNVTVYVKNSKGTIIKYVEMNKKKSAGTYTINWDVSAVSNGSYTFGIVAKDLSNKTSSVVSNFTLTKPVLVQDRTAPIIKDVTTVYNKNTKKVTVNYSVNETANVSVYVKNSKGAIVKQLQKQLKKTNGKYTLTWDVSAVSNGNYVFGITASDLSKNTSTKSLNFKLNKVLTGKINATNVLIRQKATTNSKSIGKLQKNQPVTILSKSASWYYIQTGKTKGFIYSKYLSNVK